MFAGCPARLDRRGLGRQAILLPCQECWKRQQRLIRRAARHASRREQSLRAALSAEEVAGLSAADQADGIAAQVREANGTSGTEEKVALELQMEVVSSIEKISKEEWNACAVASGEVNPFLLWEFFYCLEASGSACQRAGWLPQHVLLRRADSGELLGCTPLYLKTHSYGEYVFDHSWAYLFERSGTRYYPKLQSCVPFTPVTGNRLLIRGPHRAAVAKAMGEALKQLTDELGVSSLHLTFNTPQEWQTLAKQGYLQRTGVQYHWENDGYATFDDFLMALKQSRRKSIRQERKSIEKEGLRTAALQGADLTPAVWDLFYGFYRNTTDRKWGSAYLTRTFFHMLGEVMPERVVLMTAQEASPGGNTIAGALNMIGSHALFGRNWGCAYGDYIKNLHFELCYYMAIDCAIQHGLQRVEAGAQGQHKIQRGYNPSLTYSSHYIAAAHPMPRAALQASLMRERYAIDSEMEYLAQEASPYKEQLPPPEPELDLLSMPDEHWLAATAAIAAKCQPLIF